MDEAGNREQGPALREWGGHKVGSTSLGTGEWARKAWEPKSLRGKKVTSSEGWTPAPAQYHQPLGREWPRSFLKCLCIIAAPWPYLIATHRPVDRAQVVARVCWRGDRKGQCTQCLDRDRLPDWAVPARVRSGQRLSSCTRMFGALISFRQTFPLGSTYFEVSDSEERLLVLEGAVLSPCSHLGSPSFWWLLPSNA